MVQAWQREPRPGAPLPDQSPQSGRGQGLLCCLFLYKVTSIIFEFKREFQRRNESTHGPKRNIFTFQDIQWKYDILLVDERNIFQASLSLQEES